jgi:hypothetical protein
LISIYHLEPVHLSIKAMFIFHSGCVIAYQCLDTSRYLLGTLLRYLQTIKVENMGDTILSLQNDRCGLDSQLRMECANPCCFTLKMYTVVALLFSLFFINLFFDTQNFSIQCFKHVNISDIYLYS